MPQTKKWPLQNRAQYQNDQSKYDNQLGGKQVGKFQ
jgi:hypothetical protein